jgi:uncharacterized protein
MKISRRVRYYYLRFVRLRGDPHELALGMALGVFTGMLPIMPFQIALAVTLALLLKGSKITAALGTWISNPLNWYFLYYYSYRLGTFLLGMPKREGVFASIMMSIHAGDGFTVVVGKILGAGGSFAGAFLVGGLALGIVSGIPAYFVFLYLFGWIRDWRVKRRECREA